MRACAKLWRLGVVLGIAPLLIVSAALPAAAQSSADAVDPSVAMSDDGTLSVGDSVVASEPEFTTTMFAGEAALAYVSPLAETSERARSTAELPNLGYVSTADEVVLAWSEFDQRVSPYRIYRNGDLVGTTDETTWSDETAAGSSNSYQISTEVTASSSAIHYGKSGDLPFDEAPAPAEWQDDQYAPDWIDPAVASNDALESESLPAAATGDAEMKSDELRTVTAGMIAFALGDGESARSGAARSEASLRAANQSTFRYNTFIPSATAPAFPCNWAPGHYFGGDNRSWNPDGSYRTRVQVVLPWRNTVAPTFSKSVSPTRLYNGSGQLVDTKTASAQNITMRLNIRDVFGEFTQFTINHSATNPFCAAGAIAYSVQASITYTNDYWLDGSHRPAPNHEVYLKPNWMSIWYGLYHLPNQGFHCLTNAVICAAAPYNSSGNATP